MIRIFSRGIKKIPHLNLFLQENITSQGVVGWGYKPTAKKAREYAEKNGLSYFSLEDGFLRSVGLGVEGTAPLSLVFDDIGIYYSANGPSRLEGLIRDCPELTQEQSDRVERCIDAIRTYQLSKYNLRNSSKCTVSPKVVVIDQTVGDASISGAMADKTSFYEMLNTALENHPNEDIWVKTHPDVVCGKKEGFLYPSPIANPRIKLLSEKSSPWDLLLSARHVYTVSSLMGFEALLAGAKVYCFGMPFYAGWGVTQDRLTEPRRNRKRSISQIFYASYIQYARYVDPILSKRCQIEDTITHIIETLDRDNSQKMSVNISNLSRWKRTWIGDFLQYWQLTNEKSSTTNLVWGRQSSEVYDQLTVEDGFLRSVGLGVHFNRPISLVCDKTGIYFDSTRPSDLENILNHFTPTDWELFRSEQLIRRLNASSITKYNVGNETVPKFPANNRTILVPGQVEGDASLTFGSPIIKKNADLLQQVRINNPDAYIIYKPHPDVVAGIRDEGEWKGSYLKYADEVIVDTSMSVLLDCIDEVHTMTSLTGFEALLRGKKVTTYGVPFYSGWGLTTDKVICERRTAKRSLPELVAAALIYYPAYVDPVTRQPCSVEQALDRLIELKSGNVQVSDKKLAFLLGLKSVRRWLKAHIFRHNQ